jgi:hypothetical protein
MAHDVVSKVQVVVFRGYQRCHCFPLMIFLSTIFREFELPDTIRLWDALFSDAKRFSFMYDCCVAMVVYVRMVFTCMPVLTSVSLSHVSDFNVVASSPWSLQRPCNSCRTIRLWTCWICCSSRNVSVTRIHSSLNRLAVKIAPRGQHQRPIKRWMAKVEAFDL